MIEVLLEEIREIPEKAAGIIENKDSQRLPGGVPYLGMGSSYFACLAAFYAGLPLNPYQAAEYFHYISGKKKVPLGVLVSQSGYSSEVLWCRDLFESYIAISNDQESPLVKDPRLKASIPLHTGKESASSSKTYINTLIRLYQGFGMDCSKAVKFLTEQQKKMEIQGKALAAAVAGRLRKGEVRGIFITGTGPSIASAWEASLILTETTRMLYTAMPLAQFDHGFKEAAKDSIVIFLRTSGPEKSRMENLMKQVEKAGGTIFQSGEPMLPSPLNTLSEMVPLNFMAAHLAGMLGIKDLFQVGAKITETKGERREQ